MTPHTDTKQSIIDSARELFLSRSYADVGVAAICEHAGVKKGSFYHFFPSKQDLTLVIIDEIVADMKHNLLDEAFAEDISPLKRLERLAVMMYEFQKSMQEQSGQIYGCPIGNLSLELSTQDELIREKLSLAFKKFNENIRKVVEQAVKCGDLVDVDIDKTASAMLAYFEGVMLLAKNQNDPEVLRQLLPGITRVSISPTRQ